MRNLGLKIKKSPEIFGTRLGSIKANFERVVGKGRIWGWAVLDTISLVDAMMPGDNLNHFSNNTESVV